MIKHRGESFAFVDELAYFSDVYLPDFKPKDVFYELDTPFLTDSQFEAMKREENRRIRRKRKIHKDIPRFLLENSSYVQENYEKFLSTVSVRSNEESINDNGNNRRARDAVKNAPSLSRSQCSNSASLEYIILENNTPLTSIATVDLYSPALIKNVSKSVVSVSNSTDNREFIIPHNCKFINGDVRMLRHIVCHAITFDLIVIDPPWPNRTVKRQKSYTTFNDLDNLSSLPVHELLNDNGLVCIWLSNSEHVHSRAREIIANEWSLTELSVWHWLKICRSNYRPVVEFRPEHKVPFESLLIACKRGKVFEFGRLSDMQNFTIISVPNCNPSRKPPVEPILRQLDAHNPSNSLEIFARYLLPNTLSVGDETIKFQDSYFFTQNC